MVSDDTVTDEHSEMPAISSQEFWEARYERMQELGEDEWNLHDDGQPAKILIPDPGTVQTSQTSV